MCIGLTENCCPQHKRIALPSNCAGHRHQNSMDLPLLFIEQSRQLVVVFNCFHRFNEYRLAAGTGAVDHASDLPLELGLYRNDEALATHSNQRLLRAAILR